MFTVGAEKQMARRPTLRVLTKRCPDRDLLRARKGHAHGVRGRVDVREGGHLDTRGLAAIRPAGKCSCRVPRVTFRRRGPQTRSGWATASSPGTVTGTFAEVEIQGLDLTTTSFATTLEDGEIQLLPGDGYSLPVADKASIELIDNEKNK